MSAQIIVALFIIVIAIIIGIISFCKLSKEQKISNIKEWLKYAVIEAEKALGSGTGQLKLHMVYDMAVKQFPWIVQLVPFDVFSLWVDEALEWMRLQLNDTQDSLTIYSYSAYTDGNGQKPKEEEPSEENK